MLLGIVCNYKNKKEREVIMRKEKRFIKTHSEGSTEIWVDKETGVNYLCHTSGYSGGLTVLLDRDGKPVITTISTME